MQSRACGSNRPRGSRTSTHRIGTTGIPPCRQTAVLVLVLVLVLISMSRSPPPYQPGTVTRTQVVAGSVRDGSGNLHWVDEWSFCLTAARMAAEQEGR